MGGKSTEVAGLASRTHGVVTRAQLLRAGMTEKQIDGRLGGLLLPIHRGVYRVGHRASSIEAIYMAAVLACGDRALLSGRAATHLFELIKGGPPMPEVTAPTRRRVKGVKVHCGDVSDHTTWRGIPITTVPRTLVDLAAVLDEDDLARAVHEADARHSTKPRHVEAVLARRPKSPGAAKLRAVMRGDVPVTLSRLEKRVLNHLREAGLTLPPETNRTAGSKKVDLRWPAQRLTVELDSFEYHNSRYSWKQDRRREREARARGDEFRRYTWEDAENPAAMVAELRALLS